MIKYLLIILVLFACITVYKSTDPEKIKSCNMQQKLCLTFKYWKVTCYVNYESCLIDAKKNLWYRYNF